MTKTKNNEIDNKDMHNPEEKSSEEKDFEGPKWKQLGFTDKYHYQGFLDYNGLDPTPYRPTITTEDLELLYRVFDLEDETDHSEDNTASDDAVDALSYISEFGLINNEE